MKMSNYEAIKFIKQLELEKQEIEMNERRNSTVSYSADEPIPQVDYDFSATRTSIKRINTKIGKIKHALAVANTTVLLPGFDFTIGEGLVKLAQLQNELRNLTSLAGQNNHTSEYNLATGTMQYIDTTYDVELAKSQKKEIYETIVKLQTAIDKTNINNELDIDIDI